jgi:hypothetical protein
MNHAVNKLLNTRARRPRSCGCGFARAALSAFFAVKSSAAFLAMLLCGSAEAFPPAPHHLLYGIVRDEMGHPLTLSGAEVILESATGTIKAAIMPGLHPGVNYKLEISMDSAVTSDRYKTTALSSTLPFKLRVRIGKAVYLPIEMSGEFSKLGEPAQATRIDLTLGEDSDGDGLPDAWERALIAAAAGKLADVRPGDDPDGDGQSNLSEYQAGTYAFDSQDGFSLKVVEVKAGAPTLEFMSIRGRTYTVFGSSDLREWAQVPFRLDGDSADAADRQSYHADDSRVLRAAVRGSLEQPAMQFFRLRAE